MRKRQEFSIILCCILVFTMLFTACGSKETDSDSKNTANLSKLESGEFGPKFVPPVTLRTFRYAGPHIKFQEGEGIDNNVWTRAYEKYLGIKLKYDFIVPDYQTFDIKVMGAMASSNLPDIIPVYTTLFFRIADAGKCADLTEVYNKYASPEVKDEFENRVGGIAKSTCTRNNILAAIAGAPQLQNNILWIRTDWLKNLNLAEPKNMDDVMNIAKAFAAKDPDGNGEDDTFGMALDKNLGGLHGFANGFHAYKDIWVEKADGKLERGDIQPEWKTVLTKVNELFKAEAIDPEFISKDGEELKKDYAAQRQGMVFGAGTLADGSISMAVEANPKARWGHYKLPSSDGTPAVSQTPTRVGGFVAVNKNCKYPEALIFLANIWPKLMLGVGEQFRAYHDFEDSKGNHYDSFFYPFIGMGGPEDYGTVCQQKVSEALITGDTSKLNGEQMNYYTRSKPWHDSEKPMGWRMWSIFGPEGVAKFDNEIRDSGELYYDRGWGPETEAWKANGPDLYNKSTEYFARMILEDLPIETGFPEWQKYFNDNGGALATQEINEWWQKEGKAGFPY